MSTFGPAEHVYVENEWYDGPRAGIADVNGKPGEVIAVEADGFSVCAQGGRIEVRKVKAEGGKKVSAGDYARETGLAVGQVLGR